MAQTDILRERLFNVEKTDGNYLYYSHRDMQSAQGDEKKNNASMKSEPVHPVPQLFNNIGLDLTWSGSKGDNTIYDDAKYFLNHYVYKLTPITFVKPDEKNVDDGKKTEAVVEEIDEKLINMEHDYCSVSSESDGEFEFSRAIPYHVYKKRNRSKKRGRMKCAEKSLEKSPNGTSDIDIIDTNGSNTDLHLIEPDYSDLSFYSKNLFSYKEENHCEDLQPIDLSLSLPEESKTEDNTILSPTDNDVSAIDLNGSAILSPSENNEENENIATDLSVPAILCPLKVNEVKENTTDVNVPAILSTTKNDEKEDKVGSLCVPEILPSGENNEEKGNKGEDLSIPDSSKEIVAENDNIEVRFSRPGYTDYKPSKQFMHNIAKKVPDLLKDKSDKINILDCTYDSVNNNGYINYFFISEEIWRLFKNTSERIILTNDTNCGGERVEVNKENDIPTFLVFDESSLADSLKTICVDIGYKYKFTLLEDKGEKLVKVLEDEDCVRQNTECEVLGEDDALPSEQYVEQPQGMINSGKLKNLLLQSSRLRLRSKLKKSGSLNQISPNFDHKTLPFKKSWRLKEDVLLNQAAEEAVKRVKKSSRRKGKRRNGIINSGLLRVMFLKNNPYFRELMNFSNNLVNGAHVNQNHLCSQLPSASQNEKNKKKRRAESKGKRSREISIEEIVDLGLHLGKRTRFGEEELEAAKKIKKGRKKVKQNEDYSENNMTVSKQTEYLGENDSILSRLLLEGREISDVPKLHLTEARKGEGFEDLSTYDDEERRQLEIALLREKMKDGFQKKKERRNENKKKRSSFDYNGEKVKKPRKKEKSIDKEVNEVKLSGSRNSINEEVSYNIQTSEGSNWSSQLSEISNDSLPLFKRTDGKNKKKRGGGKKKISVVDSCEPKKAKNPRGRPRKNNALYEQCFVFDPNVWLANQEKLREREKENKGEIRHGNKKARENFKEGKKKKKEIEGKKRNKKEQSLKCLAEKLSIKKEAVDEASLETSDNLTIQCVNKQKTSAYEVPNKIEEKNPKGDVVGDTSFKKLLLERLIENKLGENIEAELIRLVGSIDDSQASTLIKENRIEEESCEEVEEDVRVVDVGCLMPVLNTLMEKRHIPLVLKNYGLGGEQRESCESEENNVGKDQEVELEQSNVRGDQEAELEPEPEPELEAEPEPELEAGPEAELEENNDATMPVLSSELEKGEICDGKLKLETTRENDDSPMPALDAIEIKKEVFTEITDPFYTEIATLDEEPETTEITEPIVTENDNLDEEPEIAEEESQSNEGASKKSCGNLKRKSRSKKKAIKRKKVEDHSSPPRNEEIAPVLKSPIIARKGELVIETNIISPVVEIEKNKEIEEAVSKQIEEIALSPIRSSSRQKKIPRIFDESFYATDSSQKKVKKPPEEKKDPDYQPKKKSRKDSNRDGSASSTATPSTSETPSTSTMPKASKKSSENDSEASSPGDPVGNKKYRIELFDPKSLSYERTTRSGTCFENMPGEEPEPKVVPVVKKNPINKIGNNLKCTIVSCKSKNSNVSKNQKLPEEKIVPRSSQRLRHTVGVVEKEKSLPRTRLSSRFKNI